MEDSPKFTNPESEIAQDFNLYVEVLNTSEDEKELLQSIFRNKREGVLTISIGSGESKELTIDPLQDEAILAEQIMDALEKMTYYGQNISATQPLHNNPQEKLTITFTGSANPTGSSEPSVLH